MSVKKRKRRVLVLIGFKSSGKTRVGKLLAKRLGFDFVDIDTVIEELHREEGERRESVRTIYKRFGRGYFDALEAMAIRHVSRRRKTVVSFGGGTPLNKAFRKKEFDGAPFVYLRVPRTVIYQRIKAKGLPPFLDARRPRQSFEELYEKRRPVYERLADVNVINSAGKPSRAADDIIQELEGRFGW